MKKNTSKSGYYFLVFVVLIYLALSAFNNNLFVGSLKSAWQIFTQIYYIFIIVFALMAAVDYFIKPKQLKKYLGEKSGFIGWLTAIVAGIISTGPIYMWYPFLSELKKSGLRSGLAVTFLYNRAIKLPLIPVMLHYFSLGYVVTLTLVMVVASVAQGYLVEFILNSKKIS